MVIYIADRFGKVLTTAVSDLPQNASIIDDRLTDELASGVRVFECTLASTQELREAAKPGNYVLAYNAPFTILNSAYSTQEGTIQIYAEDAGLDFINKSVGKIEKTSKTFKQWIEWCLGTESQSGWIYNFNVPNKTLALEYQTEDTALGRVHDIISNFDTEMYFSYNINKFNFVERTINFVARRGRADKVHQLYMDKEVLDIIETTDVSSLATVWKMYGADNKQLSELSGYSSIIIDYPANGTRKHSYHVSGSEIICTDTIEEWKTTLNPTGRIVQVKSTDYSNAQDCVNYAIREMEKIVTPLLTYDVTFTYFPEEIECGDYVNILDTEDGILLKARVLRIERSVTGEFDTAELGDFVNLEGSKRDISETIARIDPEQIQEIIEQATDSATDSLQPAIDSLGDEFNRLGTRIDRVEDDQVADVEWIQEQLNTKVTETNLQQYVDYSNPGTLNVKALGSNNNMKIDNQKITLYSGASATTEISNSSMKSPNAEIQILKMGPYVLEYMYGDDTITLK